MEESTIISLVVISVAFAWGARYGFNLIYRKDYKETFEKFREDSEKELFFRLREIGLETFKAPDKFRENVESFIKNWQDYQNNVIEGYAGINRNRKIIFVFFLVSSISLFSELLKRESIINPVSVNPLNLGLVLFLLGLIMLGAYGWEIYELNDRISKYEKEAKKRQEDNKRYIKEVMEKVTKPK